MTDSLRRAVDQYDRKKYGGQIPERLERQATGKRRICLTCRSWVRHPAFTTCPGCGGDQLVEVTG